MTIDKFTVVKSVFFFTIFIMEYIILAALPLASRGFAPRCLINLFLCYLDLKRKVKKILGEGGNFFLGGGVFWEG